MCMYMYIVYNTCVDIYTMHMDMYRGLISLCMYIVYVHAAVNYIYMYMYTHAAVVYTCMLVVRMILPSVEGKRGEEEGSGRHFY